jgi:hypothetical protein
VHPRLAELIEYADRQRAELLGAVDAIPEGRRDVRFEASFSGQHELRHARQIDSISGNLGAEKEPER